MNAPNSTDGNALTLVLNATAFAAHKHRDQRRKDHAASPYINHPISLAYVLAKEAGIDDSVVLSAALLHDTIEDTDTTIAELQTAFGRTASVTLKWLNSSSRKDET